MLSVGYWILNPFLPFLTSNLFTLNPEPGEAAASAAKQPHDEIATRRNGAPLATPPDGGALNPFACGQGPRHGILVKTELQMLS